MSASVAARRESWGGGPASEQEAVTPVVEGAYGGEALADRGRAGWPGAV